DGERRRCDCGGGGRGGGRREGSGCGSRWVRARLSQQVALERRNARRCGGGRACEVTRQPHQLLAVQLGGELLQLIPAIVGDREIALDDDSAAHSPGSAWCRKPLFSR